MANNWYCIGKIRFDESRFSHNFHILTVWVHKLIYVAFWLRAVEFEAQNQGIDARIWGWGQVSRFKRTQLSVWLIFISFFYAWKLLPEVRVSDFQASKMHELGWCSVDERTELLKPALYVLRSLGLGVQHSVRTLIKGHNHVKDNYITNSSVWAFILQHPSIEKKKNRHAIQRGKVQGATWPGRSYAHQNAKPFDHYQ